MPLSSIRREREREREREVACTNILRIYTNILRRVFQSAPRGGRGGERD
jgi:hypothetical protein